jgi:hypothetical protein
VEVGANTSEKFSTTAKARRYAEGLLGRPITEGEELSPAELYGRKCLLVVTIDTLTDGGSVNGVEQVLPYQASQDEDTGGDDDVPF